MDTTRRVFLAHGSEDKPQVREIYEKLRSLGFEPWLDEVNLLPGQDWQMEIRKAIRESRVLLAILSRRSVASVGYLHIEVRLALAAYAERPPGSVFLIPVRLDECEIPDLVDSDLKINLRDLQWVDLWKPGAFDRLVEGISAALGVPPVKEPPPDVLALEHLQGLMQSGDHEMANQQLKKVLLTYAGPEAISRGFIETVDEANRIPCDLLKKLERIFAEAGEMDGSLYLFKTYTSHPGEAWGGFGGRVWLGSTVGYRLDECGVNSYKSRL